jgi:hypothetical protein
MVLRLVEEVFGVNLSPSFDLGFTPLTMGGEEKARGEFSANSQHSA